DRSEGPWGRAVKPLARRCCAEPRTSTQSEEYLRLQTTRTTDANQVTRPRRHMGRPRPISRPWSRTGENPPYGMLGGTMETSASFEARSAPSSYPTISQAGFCAPLPSPVDFRCAFALTKAERMG